MPTTARLITRPYRPATVKLVKPRNKYMPRGSVEWALVLMLGTLGSVGAVAAIEWASMALVGGWGA